MAQTVATLHVGGEDASDDPAGDDPGETWQTAFLWLQDALDRAEVLLGGQNPPDEVHIWVAAGTYYPDEGDNQTNNARSSSFELDTNNVRLYGGFAGTESVLNQRDIFAHLTILSGDLTQDDQADFVNRDDNAFQVVRAVNVNNSVLIDGFTISGGAADASDQSTYEGGGMFIENGNPFVLRCTFSDNLAGDGGGMKVKSTSAPIVSNCAFIDNLVDDVVERSLGRGIGGGVSIKNGVDDAGGAFVNCLFAGNIARIMPVQTPGLPTGSGGALYVFGHVTLVNCTLSENHAENFAGGLFYHTPPSFEASLTARNSIFWGNTDEYEQNSVEEEQIEILGSTSGVSVSFSCVEGGWSGAGQNNIGDDPGDNPDFVNPSTDNYRLLSTSPCIDQADGDYIVTNHPDGFDLDQDDNSDPEEPTPDLDLNCRVVDDDGVSDGGGSGDYPFADMGAFEYQVQARADCPEDIFPVTGNDWNVGPGDLGELLANWGECPSPCPADLFPVGSPDEEVDAGDLGQLLANWGMCETIQCDIDFGGSEFAGGSGEGSGSLGEQDWPDVEMTEELYDWLSSSTLDDIWDWLWSLLDG